MSYHEGSNWQARKEDNNEPLYRNEKRNTSNATKNDVEKTAYNLLRDINLLLDQMPNGKEKTWKEIAKKVERFLEDNLSHSLLNKDQEVQGSDTTMLNQGDDPCNKNNSNHQ